VMKAMLFRNSGFEPVGVVLYVEVRLPHNV